jgi:hypothetical protein
VSTISLQSSSGVVAGFASFKREGFTTPLQDDNDNAAAEVRGEPSGRGPTPCVLRLADSSVSMQPERSELTIDDVLVRSLFWPTYSTGQCSLGQKQFSHCGSCLEPRNVWPDCGCGVLTTTTTHYKPAQPAQPAQRAQRALQPLPGQGLSLVSSFRRLSMSSAIIVWVDKNKKRSVRFVRIPKWHTTTGRYPQHATGIHQRQCSRAPTFPQRSLR